MVQFDETEDGTVTPHIIADRGIGRDPSLNVMFYLAEMGMPQSGLAAQALYELLDSGLVQHALAQARSVEYGVAMLLSEPPALADLDEEEQKAIMERITKELADSGKFWSH